MSFDWGESALTPWLLMGGVCLIVYLVVEAINWSFRRLTPGFNQSVATIRASFDCMSKPHLTVICVAWIVPLVFFPKEGDDFPSMGVATYRYHTESDYYGRSVSVVSSYAPIIVMPFHEGPAQFFVPTNIYKKDDDFRDSYEINPHWRYWLMWVFGAVIVTLYLQREVIPLRARI